MARRHIHLSYPRELVKQPIIYEIGNSFNIITNIRRANVDTEGGWVDLELIGEEEDLEGAIEDLVDKGVSVESVPEVVPR